MADGKFWFKHDNNADDDSKLIRVFLKHGHEGKSVFWSLIQMLHKADGYLPISDCDSLAHKCHTSIQVVNSLIHDFDLFNNDGERFWNRRALNDIQKRLKKSEDARENALVRWERNATALRPNSDGNAVVMLEDRSKNIEDRNKEIDSSCGTANAGATDPTTISVDAINLKSKKFSQPSEGDVAEYFEERQGGKWTPEDIARQAEKWYEHYTSNGWIVGRTKMKDWKAAVRKWISNDYDSCGERGKTLTDRGSEGVVVPPRQETAAEIRARIKMVY